MKQIFLVGYMGAGKTTLGKLLADKLNLEFIDLDHYIENRYHKTVGSIFAEKGEENSACLRVICALKWGSLRMS